MKFNHQTNQAREHNRIFTERIPATMMLNRLFNVLAHMTWDVDAQCHAAVRSSLTADQRFYDWHALRSECKLFPPTSNWNGTCIDNSSDQT